MRYLGSDLVFNHKGELKSTKELKDDLHKFFIACGEKDLEIKEKDLRIAELEDYCRELELRVEALEKVIEG